MPLLRLETNIPNDKIPQDFAANAIKVIAKTLGKPESYCVCLVHGGVQISWSGTTEPCAIATLASIGQLGAEQNEKHSKAISDHVEKELKIPSTRMKIFFQDFASSDIGYQGTTFRKILGN